MAERDKWGAVVIPVTDDGKILMITDTPDNIGKFERSAFQSSSKMEEVTGYQFPGGAIENGDTNIGEGAVRELLEETYLQNVDIGRLLELMVNADIIQYGRKSVRENRFRVRIFELPLNANEEKILRNNGAIEAEEAIEIRPRDRVIKALYELDVLRKNDF